MLSVDTNLKGSDDKPSRVEFDTIDNTYDQWHDNAEGAMYGHLEKKAIGK